jgi:hypothetical protein
VPRWTLARRPRSNGPAAPPSAPAALLAWLAGADNTHVTGQVVFIDGGAESIRRPELV